MSCAQASPSVGGAPHLPPMHTCAPEHSSVAAQASPGGFNFVHVSARLVKPLAQTWSTMPQAPPAATLASQVPQAGSVPFTQCELMHCGRVKITESEADADAVESIGLFRRGRFVRRACK